MTRTFREPLHYIDGSWKGSWDSEPEFDLLKLSVSVFFQKTLSNARGRRKKINILRYFRYDIIATQWRWILQFHILFYILSAYFYFGTSIVRTLHTRAHSSLAEEICGEASEMNKAHKSFSLIKCGSLMLFYVIFMQKSGKKNLWRVHKLSSTAVGLDTFLILVVQICENSFFT